MTDARAIILDRIERALRTARIPDGRSPESHARHSSQDEAARASQESGSLTLADRFVLEARALGVEVFVEWSGDAVRDRLTKLVAKSRAFCSV